MLLHKLLLVLVFVHVHLVAGSLISWGRILSLQKKKPKTTKETFDILLGPQPRKQPLTWTHRDLVNSMVPSRKPPPIPPRTFDKHDLKNTTFTSTETPQTPPPIPPRTFDKHDLKNTTFTSTETPQTPPPIPPRTFDKHDLKNTTFTSTETPQAPPPAPPPIPPRSATPLAPVTVVTPPSTEKTHLPSIEVVPPLPIMPRKHWKHTLLIPMVQSQSTRNADPQLQERCDKQCPGQQPQCMIVCLNGGIKRVVLRRTPEKIIFK